MRGVGDNSKLMGEVAYDLATGVVGVGEAVAICVPFWALPVDRKPGSIAELENVFVMRVTTQANDIPGRGKKHARCLSARPNITPSRDRLEPS